jgi:ABC-2 type transport system ATP-binding protein
MLEANQLQKRFQDKVALESLNLKVEPSEVYALLGPNGAGKTTATNLFLGFLEPDSGDVLVDGRSVPANPVAVRRKVA